MSKFKQAKTRLEQLGLTVYETPIAHLKPKELEEAMIKAGLNPATLDQLMAGQTMAVVDGVACPYPWDVEAALEKMISGLATDTSEEDWD